MRPRGRVWRHEELAAVLVGDDRGLERAEPRGLGGDLALVHADQRAEDRQRHRRLDHRKIGERLRRDLAEALARHQRLGACRPPDRLGDAEHHPPVEDDAQRPPDRCDDLALNLAEGDQVERGVELPADELGGDLARLLLARPIVEGRAVEVHEVDGAPAPHHPPGGDGRVDAAREEGQHPPAPATFSSEKKARPGRMSTATVTAACSRSTRERVAAWITCPSRRLTSGDGNGKRLSARLVWTRKLGTDTPPSRSTILAPRRSRAAPASPARATSCASERLARPNTRASRARASGQAVTSPSGSSRRAEARAIAPTGRPAVARTMLSTSRRTKKGRLRPLSAISW